MNGMESGGATYEEIDSRERADLSPRLNPELNGGPLEDVAADSAPHGLLHQVPVDRARELPGHPLAHLNEPAHKPTNQYNQTMSRRIVPSVSKSGSRFIGSHCRSSLTVWSACLPTFLPTE